jgi:hypothetical protein
MPTVLDGVSSNETVSLRWVETLANPAAPDLSSEINAVSSVPLECLVVGQFDIDFSVDRTQLRRMCSRQVRERSGPVTYSIQDLFVVYDPQDLAAPVSKAYAALTDGATGYLVERRGVHVDTAWAVGDLVRVIPVEVANANPAPPEDDNELQARVAFTVIGEVEKDVAVVA